MSWSKYVSIAPARSTRPGSVNHWYSTPMMVATTSSAIWSTSTSGRMRPCAFSSLSSARTNSPACLVALDEEVVQGVVGVEALGAEDEVEPGQDGRLDVVPPDVAQARQRQLHREGPVRVDGLHAVALGDDLAQEALLRAEVVQEPRRGHPDAIGQGGHPRAAVALRREELDGGVDDLLTPQVAPGLAGVLVGARVLPEGRTAGCGRIRWRSCCPSASTGHGVIGPGSPPRRQKDPGVDGSGPADSERSPRSDASTCRARA